MSPQIEEALSQGEAAEEGEVAQVLEVRRDGLEPQPELLLVRAVFSCIK